MKIVAQSDACRSNGITRKVYLISFQHNLFDHLFFFSFRLVPLGVATADDSPPFGPIFCIFLCSPHHLQVFLIICYLILFHPKNVQESRAHMSEVNWSARKLEIYRTLSYWSPMESVPFIPVGSHFTNSHSQLARILQSTQTRKMILSRFSRRECYFPSKLANMSYRKNFSACMKPKRECDNCFNTFFTLLCF